MNLKSVSGILLFATAAMLSTGTALAENTKIASLTPAHEPSVAMTADQALERLLQGNHRFVTRHAHHPHQRMGDVHRVSGAQHPFAVIISCSDSREVPEIITDQGLGDLFVIRLAGNVVDDMVLGSVEYAVEHLNVPLVMVLGHKRCGAVTAAVQHSHSSDHISKLVDAIEPYLQQVKPGTSPDVVLDEAVRTNIHHETEQLKESQPVLAKLIHENKVRVVGAYYDLDTGKVSVMPD